MEEITSYLIRPTVREKGVVRAWREELLLPTYEAGAEEKNPIFLEKRVYQGSSGAVYPYPVVESVSDEKRLKPYRAIFLENEYLKILILPELGGRVHMAYDKIRERHFVYYNQVVKPALVGLTGPWISGGIEFNWPQHHRPSTFLPTESRIEENADGSVTVWCNEVERMFRTKGMQGFTLHPGKAYLEIKVRIYNRTPFPQTFLWWANPAVVVNDGYHSVFPPDVHAVFDHGKRDVSTFPIATGVYYKQDYSAGVDISKYKNIPVPTSYMAIRSKYDFVGGYETEAAAGLLHVADHHLSPGKKQWTWGNGDFGRAWDRNLTDEDGPYIELMTGVYTDNQPDFSWLHPYEEKAWSQYFMPYSEVGYVKNANREAMVNVAVGPADTRVIVYTTSDYKDLTITLKDTSGHIWLNERTAISPEKPYLKTVAIPEAKPESLLFELKTANGQTILAYQPEALENKPIPSPAQAAELPEAIPSIEQLYLTGLHLEQYRHATYQPMDYYEEALRREPGDIRCNNAVGLLLLRRGQFARAEPYFRRAVETLTKRNPNPYDGEPYYNLGECLVLQGKTEEAYDAFYKSVWNAAWQDPGYYALAQLDARRGHWPQALEKVEKSLVRNGHNHRARQLKASVLRHLGQPERALRWIEESLEIDPFNLGCRFERYLLTQQAKEVSALKKEGHSVHTYLEYALDFTAAGLYEEAETLLSLAIGTRAKNYPMLFYTLGYIASCSNNAKQASKYFQTAAGIAPDHCFPNRIEEVNILRTAIEQNPSDSFAPYYLGNFFYAARQYDEAVGYWEQSAALNERFPTVWRNLALAYYNKYSRKAEAREALERAFSLDPTDARIFMELDQLYKKTGVAPQERLANLEKHPDLVEMRDDLAIERIALLNALGNYEQAKALIAARNFHPWEGGEGKITGEYLRCRIELAKEALLARKDARALELLHETDRYPHNLGEGKLATAEENDLHYYKGVAYRGLGDENRATEWFQKATIGSCEPKQAFFYNDPQPDKIFFQGLAWEALGNRDQANDCFQRLIEHGEKHLSDECRIDYFAVSLPELSIWEEDLNLRNQIHCYYVMGLGYLGLGDRAHARKYLSRVMELDVNHPAQYLLPKKEAAES